MLFETQIKIMNKVNTNGQLLKNPKTLAIIPIRGDIIHSYSLALKKLGKKLVLD